MLSTSPTGAPIAATENFRLHGSYGHRKSSKIREFYEVGGSQEKLGKIQEGQGKSGNVKVLGCKSKERCRNKFELLYTVCVQQFKIFSACLLLRSQIICTSTLKFFSPPLFLM